MDQAESSSKPNDAELFRLFEKTCARREGSSGGTSSERQPPPTSEPLERRHVAALCRRFDDICARREGAEEGGAAEDIQGLEVPPPQPRALGRMWQAAASAGPLEGLLDGPHMRGRADAMASTAPAFLGGGAPTPSAPSRARARGAAQSPLEAWAAQWREFAAEAGALEAECMEEVLGQWRTSDWASQKKSHPSQLSELRHELDESERALGRWQQDLWCGLTHLRKRVVAFVQNAHRGAVPPEQLRPVAESIDLELEGFKLHCSQDFEQVFVDDTELCQELEALGQHYYACLARPSASIPPPQQDEAGEPGLEGEKAEPVPDEDAEIAEVRALLTEVEAEIQQGSSATSCWPRAHQQVVLRTFRIFKMQLTPAFYARLEEQLPQVPSERLTTLVKHLADQESRQARKRWLLARWRRRQDELQQEEAVYFAELEAEDAAHRDRLEVFEQRLRAQQRMRVSQWRRDRTVEEWQAAALELEVGREQEVLVVGRRQREQFFKKEALHSYQAQREAAAQRTTRQREMSVHRESTLRWRRRLRNRSSSLDRVRRRLQDGPPEPEPGSHGGLSRSASLAHVRSRLPDVAQGSARRQKAMPTMARSRSAPMPGMVFAGRGVEASVN
mmetsp:Transcript_68429/g.222628  ORF Transcript_68429/g.222628 Transcript_68429/m.222628 type:complete len:618 (-) Transcript_68429:120-1973(-)